MISPTVGINTEAVLDFPGAYDYRVQGLIFDLRLGLTTVF